MTKRIAIYASHPPDGSTSVDEQLRQLRTIAAATGETVVAEHMDRGVAKSIRSRAGLNAVLRAVEEGAVDVILVRSLNRLATNLPDLVRVLDRIARTDVTLRTLVEEIDTATQDGRAIVHAASIMQTFAKQSLGERIRAGQQRSREAGVRFGRPAISEAKIDRIRAELIRGEGVRPTARTCGVSPSMVCRIKQEMAAGGHGAAVPPSGDGRP